MLRSNIMTHCLDKIHRMRYVTLALDGIATDSSQSAWRRKAGVLRKSGKIDKAVEELSAMLDTFYTEVEGWIELADIYASCQQFVMVFLSIHSLMPISLKI